MLSPQFDNYSDFLPREMASKVGFLRVDRYSVQSWFFQEAGAEVRHRFTPPGTHNPLSNYTDAEQAPPNETVP